MAEPQEAPTRPWTPTERPGDTSYTSAVVFHGDHRVRNADEDSDSEVSWEDDKAPQSSLSPGGEPFDNDTSRPQPLRFRSSYTLRDDAAASAPEAQVYQPYRQPQTLSTPKDDLPPSLRPQRSSQALNVSRGDQIPSDNPYRLSLSFESTSNDGLPTTHSQASSDILKKEHNDSQLPSNNSYRLSQAMRSESTEGLLVRPQQKSQAPPTDSSDDLLIRPQRLSQALRTESIESMASAQTTKPQQSPEIAQSTHDVQHPTPNNLASSTVPTIEVSDDLPSITGTSTKPISILLINPNSTKSMTTRCLESIASTLPPHVTVYGFTAPHPAPTAIESQTDAIMSTAACTRAVLPIAHKYNAFLVACFSHHPLITALREQLAQPVIGIMEASLYASRMLGGKIGIVTTGIRSSLLHDASLKSAYGLGAFSVGTESSRLSVLELESRDPEEVQERIAMAARRLQSRGADCICLGCAGMTDLQRACQEAVGMSDRVAMIVDGVAVGVHFLVGLVREGLGTARGLGDVGGRYKV
ncbi:hypothetical protein PMZ80_007457 [Knufia obscura]|uniref:Hydantoin racemase n=1 Tax=Knufia obscura TaxID=1635080 RepID=A0ABR0RIK9_9EURO|nr:hypothetical protein PMZ80_007457 [Knufia obscura]